MHLLAQYAGIISVTSASEIALICVQIARLTMMQTIKYIVIALPFVAMLAVIAVLAYESIRDLIEWLKEGRHF